ncbi:MAG TPA: helix-turn-helix domain-containing protein, partial [Nitrospirota bacterium]
ITNYQWPGNVRQLINVLEHGAMSCKAGTIEVSDLPDYIFGNKPVERPELCIDRERIRAVLAMFQGNKTLAAKHLGMSRVTLWKRIKEHGIK